MISVFTVVSLNINSQSLPRFQIIDSKYKTPIPFAYVKVPNKNILEVTDLDGYFMLPKLDIDSIQISHVAYKPMTTTFDKIYRKNPIQLEEVPIEVNPIIISAKDTKVIVDNSIGKNYKSIHTPLYLLCYRKDLLLYRDTLVAEAYAEIIFKVDHLFSPSSGGIIKSYLQNISVKRNPQFKGRIIPKFDLEANFSPINEFIVRSTNDQEKTIYFSKQDSGDSIVVININPRLDFKPNKRFVIQNGRIIINKLTGKILRIDTDLNPKMMEISRMEEYRAKDTKRYIYHYSISELFNQEGIIIKLSWKYKFSFLENNPINVWENSSEFYFVKELDNPPLDESICILKKDSTLVQMRSQFKSDFEKKLSSIFN
jgi:hypothetical protein